MCVGGYLGIYMDIGFEKVMITGKKIGYVRVSTADQNTDRQLDGMDLDKIFTEKVSGKNRERPELSLLLDYVREGDVVFVHSMDRLARNLRDLNDIVKEMTDQKVSISFVKENLTFSGDDSAMSMLLLNIIGSVAEFERAHILDRQKEGIIKAKEKGKFKGTKKRLNDEQIKEVRRLAESGMLKTHIANKFGVSARTVHRYLKI